MLEGIDERSDDAEAKALLWLLCAAVMFCSALRIRHSASLRQVVIILRRERDSNVTGEPCVCVCVCV